MSTIITTEGLLALVNNFILDKHIDTDCENFIATCYNLFYNTTALDVTFTIGSTSYTIPNMAKNSGVIPTEGVVDPEDVEIGVLGQFYFNSLTRTIFFKASVTEEKTGWVELFQYVASPTDDDTLDNITQVLTNSQNMVSLYYTMFYDTVARDVTIQLYDENGELQTYTIPNRAKSLKSGITGEGSPEGVQTEGLGTIYIDTSVVTTTYTSTPIYIKTTASGNVGWVRLLNSVNLEEHNNSATAHNGYLARIDGSTTQTFNVATPVSNTHAVNINYVGALSDLSTTSKTSIVSAINEVYDMSSESSNIISTTASAQPWTMVNGNLNSSGDADLMFGPNDAAAYLFDDRTPLEYTDNIEEGSWVDNLGSLTNVYTWGNKGKVFGAPVGTGFNGWSQVNSMPNTPQSDNIGYINNPIKHGMKEGAGTYKFAISGDGVNNSMLQLGTVLETSVATTGNGGTITVNADVRDYLNTGYIIKISDSSITTINGTYKVKSLTYVAPTTEDPEAKTIITLAVAGTDNINMPASYTQATGDNIILKYYTFRLVVTYDDVDHEIAIPDSISDIRWTYTSEFTVSTSLTSIRAWANANQGEWFIGGIHLLKVIPYSTYHSNLNKVYFKAGAGYASVGYTDITNKVTTVPALASIDLSNKADGTYRVFVNNSSYNKGAFNTVGSPTISTDGVVSDSDSSNYVTIPVSTVNSLASGSWEIKVPFSKIPVGTAGICLIGAFDYSKYRIIVGRADTTGNLYFYVINSSGSAIGNTYVAVSESKSGYVTVGFTGSKYYMTVDFSDGSDSQTVYIESETAIGTSTYDLPLMYNNSGEMDLSKIQVIANTYKSDYTVVGTPTITDDGIARLGRGSAVETASTKYIILKNMNISNLKDKNWKVKGRFYKINTTDVTYSGDYPVVMLFTFGGFEGIYGAIAGNIQYNIKNGDISFGGSFGTTSEQQREITLIKMNIGTLDGWTDWSLEFNYSTGAYTLTAGGISKTATPTVTEKQLLYIAAGNTYPLGIGWAYNFSYIMNTNFDLKQFSITVDGVEVYRAVTTNSATLLDGSAKLPYLAQSTSVVMQKVAPTSPAKGCVWKNIAYAPMEVKQYNGSEWVEFKDNLLGDVTIASNKVTVVDTYPYNNRWVNTASHTSPAFMISSYTASDGSYWTRLWCNGYKEQGGNGKSISTSATTISLSALPFSTANYTISVSPVSGTATFGSQTTTSFTITGSTSTTCCWVARGF